MRRIWLAFGAIGTLAIAGLSTMHLISHAQGQGPLERKVFVRSPRSAQPNLKGPTTVKGNKSTEDQWIVHSSFKDFSGGMSGDSGSNLFISQAGEIQMIHRWDFNNDGFLDLFVGQDHDIVENEDILIYWGQKQGPQSILPDLPTHQPLGRLLRQIAAREKAATRLPSDGGGRSLLVDLNGDGYLEIVFCNFIHNYSVHMNALVYWGGPKGYGPDRRTELPTLLADGLAAADFNQDGYIDLVFANRGIEGGERFGFDQHLESYVYWNGPAGFSPDRKTALPTISAADVAAGDLNGDNFPDLLFVNNNSQEKSLYLYWGGSEGFSEKRRDSWKTGDIVGLQLVDLNDDRKLDVIAIHRDDRAQVFRGTGKGFEQKPWLELPTMGAVQCRVADLNKDNYPDLVFANEGKEAKQFSCIYWGNAQGYAVDRRSDLPTLHATDAAIADFDGDGWLDIAFSNEHDDKTYDVDSYIYWNSAQGFHAAVRTQLRGFGAVGTQAADLNQDGHQDLVLVNRTSGSKGPIDSLIYWGNPRHDYSPSSMSVLPGMDQVVPAIADLDQNGYVDIVFPNGWIYWGGAGGYSSQRRQELAKLKGHSASVADLNRDGYLDLVITTDSPSTALIFWGSAQGYRYDNRAELKLTTQISLGSTIADFNKDGYLDLIFTDVDSEKVDLFWGSPNGAYTSEKHTKLAVQSSATVETADLNQDGWLDLILGGGWDRKRFGRPTCQATLLWGGPKGFSAERSSRLEAYDALEQAVADLNQDGYLDIVMTNYHAYLTRTVPTFIYWGSAEGTYSESRRSSLPAESSSALTVADLNQDGWKDIVVFNHVDRGDHAAGANIFWGGSQGYSFARRHWIPTFGPHFGVRRDIGNIYSRRLEEEYVSAPLNCPALRTPSRLTWKALTPHGTAVNFQIRSAAREIDLKESPWQGPNGPSGYYERSGASLQVAAEHRWIQYRVVLSTPAGGSTPVLQSVSLDAGRQ